MCVYGVYVRLNIMVIYEMCSSFLCCQFEAGMWNSAVYNMGFAFKRTVWTTVKSCAQVWKELCAQFFSPSTCAVIPTHIRTRNRFFTMGLRWAGVDRSLCLVSSSRMPTTSLSRNVSWPLLWTLDQHWPHRRRLRVQVEQNSPTVKSQAL